MNKQNIISSKGLFDLVRRTMQIMDDKVRIHGEIVSYILYQMLKTEGIYTDEELAEYTLIGLLHDIGSIKTGYDHNNFADGESKNVWAHSIYGYLFLRYLSPIGDMADIVLYHHLPYNKHTLINSRHLKIVEYLTLADKMDVFMRMEGHGMNSDYFTSMVNIDFSAEAMEAFGRAKRRSPFLTRLQTGAYEEELNQLMIDAEFSAKFKKKFLEMLVYAIDFRSQQTVLHSIATTTFATQIGKLFKFDYSKNKMLYYGALLHDIGKIAIPLDILESPRRLSDEEMRIMKAHVIISEHILRGLVDDQVVEIAIRHHEKLDGTGYHRGLKGDELTLSQRILAVADILSALYGKRSYKEAFDSEKVKEILLGDARAGKICMKVVEMVISNYETIIDNYEKQREDSQGLYMTISEQYEEIYEKFKVYEK